MYLVKSIKRFDSRLAINIDTETIDQKVEWTVQIHYTYFLKYKCPSPKIKLKIMFVAICPKMFAIAEGKILFNIFKFAVICYIYIWFTSYGFWILKLKCCNWAVYLFTVSFWNCIIKHAFFMSTYKQKCNETAVKYFSAFQIDLWDRRNTFM